MDILEEIKDIIDKLNEIDDYSSNLSQIISELDLRQQDLLHLIENSQLKTNECYRVIRELKKVREKRRKAKIDFDLYNKFLEQENKLILRDNRQFLLTELNKKNKILNSKYKNRIYTNDEMIEILSGKEVLNER